MVVQRLAKRCGCLLSYSQAEPGRELTQPSPRLLAEPCTPLSWAAWRGQTNAVKQLLLGGADPERADNTGNTPLQHAKQRGNDDVVQVLLETGT